MPKFTTLHAISMLWARNFINWIHPWAIQGGEHMYILNASCSQIFYNITKNMQYSLQRSPTNDVNLEHQGN
jgi:hypothetical protein